MIVELHDGRELKFPDTLTEKEVQRIVKEMLRLEKVVSDSCGTDEKATRELGEVMASVELLDPSIPALLKRIIELLQADRALVLDSNGEPIRSRVVPRAGP